MSWLSRLFGQSSEDKALAAAMQKIRRVIEDEHFQLEMLPPAVRQTLLQMPAVDVNPGASGPFGKCAENPIPTNGPVGQVAYLSKLETERGEQLLFHRIGAIGRVDVYEAVTLSGGSWHILFMDMYHPRQSRLTPGGFRFCSHGLAQFSGFNTYCQEFPYDFVEQKQRASNALSFAMIPLSQILPQLQSKVFRRPHLHVEDLDAVRRLLTTTPT